MKLTRWLLIVFVIYVLIFFSHALFLQKTVYGDGVFYYSWVRSVVVDRDINFTNEYAHFGVAAPVTPGGLPGNKPPIGGPSFCTDSWLNRSQIQQAYSPPQVSPAPPTSFFTARSIRSTATRSHFSRPP